LDTYLLTFSISICQWPIFMVSSKPKTLKNFM
jgi:hypothetical protein